MFRINRKQLEQVLTEVAAARWHDAERRSWLASIIAVLMMYASRARGTTERSHRPAERIVWTVFQCVSNPDDERKEAREHLELYDRLGRARPADFAQLNGFVKRLLLIFGVQKALHAALLRMQAREPDELFYTSEYWEARRDWLESEFFGQ